MTSYFIVRMESRGIATIEDALKHDYVAVGWSNIKQLPPRAELKNRMKHFYPELYEKARALGNASGSLDRFLYEITEHSKVLLPIQRGFYVGEVQSGPFYSDTAQHRTNDVAWQYKVRWLNNRQPIPRTHADSDLESVLKSRQTCIDITRYAAKVEKAMARSEPLQPVTEAADAIYKKTAVAIVEGLQTLGPDIFENFICTIIERDGAKTKKLTKNASDKGIGDADIIGTYRLGNGLKHNLDIAFQVKRHNGISNDHGIKQVLQYKKDHPNIALGCLVTSAIVPDEIFEHYQEEIKTHQLKIIDRDGLVEWIARSGILFDKE